jgi:hypothetical protein
VVIQDYLDLITSQYKNSPKFQAWVECLLTPFVDTQELAENLYTYFDIDTAFGKQLDMLGEIIGAKRLLPFQPTIDNPLLDDNTYRFLLKAQILKNFWDGTNQDIYDKWDILFNDLAISLKDNQDMTITVIFIGELSQLKKEMIEYGMIVPKAQGVRMFYSFSIPPLFSYDQDTEYFKGYDEGNWYEIQ